jgi:CubicO group peptidase (beta-lactamase class C family)
MRRTALAALCAVLFAAPARADTPSPQRTPRTIEELRSAIAEVLARERVPGVGIALVERGRTVWVGGVGLADVERKKPVTADTLFRVASVTKSFIALAALRLVERGQLDLRARVADLAPEIAIGNRWQRESPITVAHLLEHTAGFDDIRPNESSAPLAAEAMPLVDVLARNPRSRVARWRPGARWSYANTGYTVAAYVIEKVTGRRYEDVVRDEVLAPLGMGSARLVWSREADARLARGHDRERVVPYAAIYHRPSGNLMASPRHLAALVEMYLARGGTLISPASMARMERSETADLRGTDLDYGLGNHGEIDLPVPARGHGGAIQGFFSDVAYASSAGVGWVVLLNSTGSFRALADIRALVAAYLLRGRTIAPPPRVPVPDAELARWAGTYRFDSPRYALFAFLEAVGPRLEITHTPGRLWAGLQGRPERHELIPMGRSCFRLPKTSGCFFAFAGDGDARVLYGPGTWVHEPAWRATAIYYAVRAILLLLTSGLLLIFMGGRWLWAWIASLSFFAAPAVFLAGARADALGELNVYTASLFALTLLFAVGSGGAVVAAFQSPTSGPLSRAYRWLFAAAAMTATLFFTAHHIIGLRIWSW